MKYIPISRVIALELFWGSYKMRIFLCLFVASALISLLITWGARNFAVRRGIVSPPDAHHIHHRSVPRIGGIAIFTTFSSFVFLYILFFLPGHPHNVFAMDIAKIAVPGTLLFGVGLVDDICGLRARIKLVFQIAGGLCLYCSGLSFPALDLNVAGLPIGAMLSFSLTVFWVVLLCNGLNFIDGLDGLAAGTAFLICLPLLIFALITGRPVLSVAIVMFSGTLLGFLVFNFNPASIFLGDSGSLFIGFLLSGFLLSELRNGTHGLRLTLSLLIAFALPVTDTALSVLRRLLNRRALFSPDREHIHHRLMTIGYPHRQVVLILYGVSITAAGFSVFLAIAPTLAAAGASVLCFLLAVGGIRKLRYMEYSHVSRLLRMSLSTTGSRTIHQQSGDLAKSTYGLSPNPYPPYAESWVAKPLGRFEGSD